MKKRRIATILAALFVVILCVSLLVITNRIEKIKDNQVEKIIIWSDTKGEYEFNSDETAEFINLYNSSKYKGKATGEGGTPEFGIRVVLRDGGRFNITNVCCSDEEFELSIRNSDGEKENWYYFKNQSLYDFALDLIEKAENRN